MSTATATAPTSADFTLSHVLALVQFLPDDERQRLIELLTRDEDAPLPEQATVDEAIELFLADACSLSRAAELAGVTRWDLLDRLGEREIKIPIRGHRTAAEIDALAKEMEHKGIL